MEEIKGVLSFCRVGERKPEHLLSVTCNDTPQYGETGKLMTIMLILYCHYIWGTHYRWKISYRSIAVITGKVSRCL